MSPTRRDVFKAAGALTAVLAMPQAYGALAADSAPLAPTSVATLPALRHNFRSAKFYGVIADPDTGQREVCHVHIDRDLDGSWSVWATPDWRRDVFDDDDDPTGYYRTDEHDADTLLDATWDALFAPRPRLLAVTPFHDDQFELLWEPLCARWHETWTRRKAARNWSPTRVRMNVDEITAYPVGWDLVTNRSDILAQFPAYDAIIMLEGRFYLAVLEGAAR